ncbi:MAG: alpha/beta hydrolase [Acidimicrobiia bacterium]|nr:alpha/beta hydrolase [Acidimicrobiia bacterium]
MTETIELTAHDGHPLTMVNVRGDDTSRGPVLLVHGAGVRADIFRPPTDTTLVDVLVAAGYDVWLENWRASIEHAPNQWTLDQAALFDHPAAVRTVLDRTGADSLPAIVHCQGSTSFVLAAVAGLLPDVSTIVSNAVSLHPVIRPFAAFKLRRIAPILDRWLDYIDPGWGNDAHGFWPKATAGFVRLTHHECDNTVCRLVSFTYGYGYPCLWSHENLSDETHDWIRTEFGPVPFTFFSQIHAGVAAAQLVTVDGDQRLPRRPADQPPRSDARFVFLAGRDNKCFLPESQERTYEWFDRNSSADHSLHLFADYGHLDVFIGENAARDIFPVIIDELAR